MPVRSGQAADGLEVNTAGGDGGYALHKRNATLRNSSRRLRSTCRAMPLVAPSPNARRSGDATRLLKPFITGRSTLVIWGRPSTYHLYGWYRDGKMVEKTLLRVVDSEKLTINMGFVDL